MEMKAETEWMVLWQGSNEYRSLPHSHDDWIQVTMPVMGTCHFTQEARSYRLKQGNGLIQPTGTNHHFNIGERTSVITIKVRERGIGGLASVRKGFKAGAGHDIRLAFDTDEVVGRFREWMLAMIQGQTLADPLAIEEVEHGVMSYLNGLLEPNSDRLPRSAKDITNPHLLRTIAYLHDCYENMISIDELAGIAMQSRFHFIRSFREATGKTPYQYLLKLRMEKAMILLRRSDATIGKISADLGFSSTSQFHRAFLKTAGMTPQTYRLQ